MADKPAWYDRPMWDRGLSVKDAAIVTGAVAGPPMIIGGAIGYAEGRLEKRFGVGPMAGKQKAPRYHDQILSPRGQIRKIKQAITHAKSDPAYKGQLIHLEKHLKQAKASAKMVATKVDKKTLNPFIASRAKTGTFQSTSTLARAGRALGTAGRVLGMASGAVVLGAAGVATYNVLTGKHAADRDEAIKRENDPGRIATSGAIGTVVGAVANRAFVGVASTVAGGVVARAVPLAAAGLAAHGAFKGYAEEGVKGAVRGAVSSLTMGLADKQMEKVLGPKKSSSRPFKPLQIPNIFGGRSEEFKRANAQYGTDRSGKTKMGEDGTLYKDHWSDSRGRQYTRRDMSVRSREA